jgi:hypothetical protein
VSSFCVSSQPAPSAGAAACSQDSDCQSYHCLQLVQGKYCLQGCVNDLNCQQPARCQTLNVTISGVQGTVKSCGPA